MKDRSEQYADSHDLRSFGENELLAHELIDSAHRVGRMEVWDEVVAHCGHPDAAEACRIIIGRAKHEKKVTGWDD